MVPRLARMIVWCIHLQHPCGRLCPPTSRSGDTVAPLRAHTSGSRDTSIANNCRPAAATTGCWTVRYRCLRPQAASALLGMDQPSTPPRHKRPRGCGLPTVTRGPLSSAWAFAELDAAKSGFALIESTPPPAIAIPSCLDSPLRHPRACSLPTCRPLPYDIPVLLGRRSP